MFDVNDTNVKWIRSFVRSFVVNVFRQTEEFHPFFVGVIVVVVVMSSCFVSEKRKFGCWKLFVFL